MSCSGSGRSTRSPRPIRRRWPKGKAYNCALLAVESFTITPEIQNGTLRKKRYSKNLQVTIKPKERPIISVVTFSLMLNFCTTKPRQTLRNHMVQIKFSKKEKERKENWKIWISHAQDILLVWTITLVGVMKVVSNVQGMRRRKMLKSPSYCMLHTQNSRCSKTSPKRPPSGANECGLCRQVVAICSAVPV